MTINELEEKFTIKPFEDIAPHFKLLKTLSIDIQNHHYKMCFNCGDTANSQMLKSQSWTAVQQCFKCKSLNVIIYTDRMGGNSQDTIECYGEK